MVSATGRKRSPQQGRRSRQGTRSQQGKRQKSHGRRSPAKQRKHQGQTKRQPVEKKRKRALKGSFHSINAKTLNRIKRGGPFLSRQARGLMISFVEDFYKQVSSEAERLRKKSHDSLILPAHVQAALQRVMPKRRWRPVPTVASRSRQ